MVLLNADHDLQRFVIYNVHVFVAHKYVDVVYHEMLQLLSVQCNTLHGTEYKITCGLCQVCVSVCLSVCLSVRTGFGGRISRKRLEIEVRFQF